MARPRFFEASIRRKLEVATAMALESLVEAHVEQATQLIGFLEEYEPLEESLIRYLREMDLTQTMALAVRTRVLIALDADEQPAGDPARSNVIPARAAPAVSAAPADSGEHAAEDTEDSAWSLLRQPQRMVEGVKRRQRRAEEIERITMLALARAEEHLIQTHVENAIGFVALLDEEPLHDAVRTYLGEINLAGGRAQAVFQRTMARLADVHLPTR